jgi:hypothetical protein
LGSTTAEVERFISRFDDRVARLARRCLAWVRSLVPGATELVYDAYNALSIVFATDDKLKSAFVHVAVYPRHVNIGFNRGAELEDPERVLVGTGTRIRHVRIDDDSELDKRLAALVRRAARYAGHRSRPKPGKVVVKRVYARQRPRRPRVRGAAG